MTEPCRFQDDIVEIKQTQKEILVIISDNKAILNEIKNLREGLNEFKITNEKIHDIIFTKLSTKFETTNAKWGIGISLTVIGLIFAYVLNK